MADLFGALSRKLSQVIGHEIGRQNAIARFGSGIPLDSKGMMVDPRDPTKKIHVDDFQKLPIEDRWKTISPSLARQTEVKQIGPDDLNQQTEGLRLAELLKSSFKSDDQIGQRMRGG